MATIYNSDLTSEIIKAIKAATARDSMPYQIAEKVVPVIEVNPSQNRVANIVRVNVAVNATTATIYTTPTTKDFYLTGASLSLIKDATATSTRSYISIVIDGLNTGILDITGITLTPQNQTITISFPTPIKIDRGTNINIVNTTNVANVNARGDIIGYTVEP